LSLLLYESILLVKTVEIYMTITILSTFFYTYFILKQQISISSKVSNKFVKILQQIVKIEEPCAAGGGGKVATAGPPTAYCLVYITILN